MKVKFITLEILFFVSFLSLNTQGAVTSMFDNTDRVDTVRFVETFRHKRYPLMLFCYDASGNIVNQNVLLNVNGASKDNCFFFVHSGRVKKLSWVGPGDASEHILKINGALPRVIYTTPNAVNNRFCGFYVPENKVDSVRNPATKGLQIGVNGNKGDTCDVSIRSGRYGNGKHIEKHFQAWGFIASGDTLKGTFNGLPVLLIYKDKSTVVLDTKRKEDRHLLKTIINDCPLEAGVYKRFGYTIGDSDN